MGKAKLVAVFIALAAAASCLCTNARGEPVSVRESLVGFLHALAGGDEQVAGALGWNASLDPCRSAWRGVMCSSSGQVVEIALAGLNLRGTVDAALLCAAPALRVVTLSQNGLRGVIPEDISTCSGLTRLSLRSNQLAGTLPHSLPQLKYLRVLDASGNNLHGEFPPGLDHLVSLDTFLANDNHFSGIIPDFDLTRFVAFNVSNNMLTGPIPRRTGTFGAGSFWPNAAGLCGQPLFSPCAESPSLQPSYSNGM